MIHSLDQLLDIAKKAGRKRVAVACAQDPAAFEAVLEAAKLGIAHGLLIGDTAKIAALQQRYEIGEAAQWLEVINEPQEDSAIARAVRLAHNEKADIILKGSCKTGSLLKGVLDKQYGIGTGRLLSDAFVYEDTERGRLIIISDGGVVLTPTLEQKIAIIENAVSVAHALGNPNPKVALLSAVETVLPNLPASVEADAIARMNREGRITGCVIEGPLSLDLAISEESARTKGMQSPVAGKADILIPPDIISANLLAKATLYYGKVRIAHVIVGARVPILIPSRADSADAKLLSIALGVINHSAARASTPAPK